MNDKILKELKELNKTLLSMKTFAIVNQQQIKTLTMEIKKISKELQLIKLKEEKDGDNK